MSLEHAAGPTRIAPHTIWRRHVYVDEVQAFAVPEVGGVLRFLDFGDADGPARVYLHGLGFSSASLVHVAADPTFLPFRSVLVDLLGFGLSDRPETLDYTIETHASAVIGLLDELEIRTCELVGHSLGGSIAIVVASRRPDLVSSLVAAEANLTPGIGPFSGRILAMSEESYVKTGFAAGLDELQRAADRDRIAAITLGMQRLASPHAMYRTARSLVEERTPTFEELLVALNVPCWFIVGAKTLEAPERPPSGEDGDGLEALGIRRLIVPDAGHLMPLENPHGFVRALGQAVER